MPRFGCNQNFSIGFVCVLVIPFDKIIKDWDEGKITTADALKLCNMSESTFYRRRREYKLMHK